MGRPKKGRSRPSRAPVAPSRPADVRPADHGIKVHPGRFWRVFLGVAILANVWTVALAWCVPRDHFFRWYRHALTFSVVHWTTFACAVALFATTLDREYFRRIAPIRWRLLAGLSAAFVFGTIMVVTDSHDHPVEPYMLRDASGALDTEVSFRSRHQRLPADPGGPEHEEYFRKLAAEYLPIVRPPGDKPEWKRLNLVFYVNEFLTWFFVMFDAAFAVAIVAMFYIKMKIFPPDQDPVVADRRYYNSLWSHYLAVFVLIASWFPFRIYASYYQNCFLSTANWIASYPAFVALAVLMVSFLAVLLLLRDGEPSLTRLAVLGTVGTSVAAVVGYFNQKFTLAVLEVLDGFLNSGFVFFLAIVLAILAFALSVCWLGTK